MGLQANLDLEAIEMLHTVCEAIDHAAENGDHTNGRNMYHGALMMINNSIKPISEMSKEELYSFEVSVYEGFIYKGWL